MISYFVGRNLGHLSPCVAVVDTMARHAKQRIRIYAFPQTHKWLNANLTGRKRVSIRSFDKLKTFGDEQIIKKSDLIFHDWREEVRKLKQLRKADSPIFAGMYHSDLHATPMDNNKTLKFKRQIKQIAEQTTDIFFHINLHKPKEEVDFDNCYVPIPIVVRQAAVPKERVKKKLDLASDEPFVLVVMGGGMGPYRYKYLDQWYDIINRMRLNEPIIIANQLGGVKFAFNNKRIKVAPLFPNGMDLVSAADLVIGKPGMGILMDCIASGTPLLALPADTKEREVKNHMLQEVIGDDICVLNKACRPEELKQRIDVIMANKSEIKKAYKKIPANGAEVVAQAMRLLAGRRLGDLKDLHRQILKLTPFG